MNVGVTTVKNTLVVMEGDGSHGRVGYGRVGMEAMGMEGDGCQYRNVEIKAYRIR